MTVMLKNFYSKLSLNKLTPLNNSTLEKTSKKIIESGFKILSPESYTTMLIAFTVNNDLQEAEDLIVLNLNIYSLFSNLFTVDNWSIEILAKLSNILVKIDREKLERLAFIICANPFTLTEYFKKENINLNKDVRILHLAPTSLYFSLFQKTINYLILEYERGFNNELTFDRILQQIVDTNILLNKSNNYLTEHVVKADFYDVFTIGGFLLKVYTTIEENSSPAHILVGLETPPSTNTQLILESIREPLLKIGVSVKNFLEFKCAHIQPFNNLYRIMERAYIEVVGEHPYIDWFTIPSTVEIFNNFFETGSQLIFGPGTVSKPIEDRVFEEQFSLFLKVFNNYLKIRRGV
ncbi:MAG: hypothetical protein OdinLCB4_001320 [Candidatus Odinarchaeum yellowstonii]|uniref:Uncharacterized protein n=1 Tax=Odinarchaeota yellowstonii (strain LCB_4) TaxID=1841599 RepID=A0AAF0IBN6_ODILC|nr:MAG: hypothetical protein OdinLCB4_001320 [Candidatus Odinarchaeum yellowstonii]